MTVFVDTSIIMYAAGRPHRHRQACRGVLERVADGDLDAVTSAEVVQEILHRFAHGDREVGVRMARGVVDLFGDLLPVDRATVNAAIDRHARAPSLSARDALHVATCAVHGLTEIVSVDTDFDGLDGLTRLDPEALVGPSGRR